MFTQSIVRLQYSYSTVTYCYHIHTHRYMFYLLQYCILAQSPRVPPTPWYWLTMLTSDHASRYEAA
jgi:hypothetical protein